MVVWLKKEKNQFKMENDIAGCIGILNVFLLKIYSECKSSTAFYDDFEFLHFPLLIIENKVVVPF